MRLAHKGSLHRLGMIAFLSSAANGYTESIRQKIQVPYCLPVDLIEPAHVHALMPCLS